MKKESKHTSSKKVEDLNKEILPRMEIPFKKDKEEVWEALAAKMDQEPESAAISYRIPAYLYIAASFVVLLTVATLFLRNYTYTDFSGNDIGSLVLPDGSTIETQHNSEISYHPYWWRIRREVMLEGEGYFEVEKGNTFSVISSKGITEVVGTTFTVYSRSEQYKVSCYSGSVKVRAVNKTVAATLLANEEVLIDKNGNYNVRLIKAEIKPEPIEEKYYFIFNSTPIQEVLGQISSYYSVHINMSPELDLDFSGNFSRALKIEDVLEAICIPFELDYVQNSKTEYTINPK